MDDLRKINERPTYTVVVAVVVAVANHRFYLVSKAKLEMGEGYHYHLNFIIALPFDIPMYINFLNSDRVILAHFKEIRSKLHVYKK